MDKLSIKQKIRKKRKSDFGVAMIFALPFTICLLVFVLYPFVMSFFYSLTEFSTLKPPVFVGLENYETMFKDKLFWKSLLNTGYMVVFGVPLVCGLGLLLAVLLNVRVPGLGFFRTFIYLPSVVPAVAVGLTWGWMMNPEHGVINYLLGFLGVENIGWLSDPRYTKIALLAISVWTVGGVMVMYLAALQDVPKELYESAEIDGAGSVQKFFHITIPSIKAVMYYNILTTMIGFFQYFASAYILNVVSSPTTMAMSLGAPEQSTLFIGTYIYANGFKYMKMGYACALSWVLLLISLVAMVVMMKSTGMIDADEE